MRYLFSCLFLCLVCFGTKGQSFDNISPVGQSQYTIANTDIRISKDRIYICSSKDKNLKKQIPVSLDNKEFRHRLLYNSKLQQGFLFIEKHSALSEGCQIYRIDKGNVNYLCEFPFAAYTSENGERMNYNSILSYLSVIRSDKRTLLFINTPMVVLYPNSPQEEILETKTFYHQLSNNGFELRKY